jgi:NhaP-type Na+/H+ and K+/H+ antiporter
MYRHLSTTIIFNQQYLLGKNAISPIIRNQTTHVLCFNSKTKRTIENLYQNFGQMFDSEKQFKEYFLNITKEPHVAMLYMESEDDIKKNYLPIIAPAEYPTYKISY